MKWKLCVIFVAEVMNIFTLWRMKNVDFTYEVADIRNRDR